MADLVSTVDGASLSVAGVVYSAVYAVLLLWAVAASAVRAHHGGRFKAAVAVVLIAHHWWAVGSFGFAYVAEYWSGVFGPGPAASALLPVVVVIGLWSHDADPPQLCVAVLGSVGAGLLLWAPLDAGDEDDPALSTGRPGPSTGMSFKAFLPVAVSAALVLSETIGTGPEICAAFVVTHLGSRYFITTNERGLGEPSFEVSNQLVFTSAAAAAAGMQGLALATVLAVPITPAGLRDPVAIDLVLCIGVILAATFWQLRSAAGRLAGCALALAWSPAAMLAVLIADVRHGELVTAVQFLVAELIRRRHRSGGGSKGGSKGAEKAGETERGVAGQKLSKGKWMNLGLHTGERNFDSSAERLAHTLGSQCLGPGDRVLACGAGRGAELRYFKKAFGLKHITGIELSKTAVEEFVPDENVRMLRISADGMKARFPAGVFNRVIALDSAYHFASRDRFFADAAAMLPPSGKLCVTDITTAGNGGCPSWLSVLLSAMNVSRPVTAAAYESSLRSAGFETVEVLSLGSDVLAEWLPRFMVRHLDYVVVTATKPASAEKTKRRRKVAIIGSGMAGMATAHYLGTLENDVTMFEAKSMPGLSGFGEYMEEGGIYVDIPLRMISIGYYNEVIQMMQREQIPTKFIKVDCCFWSRDPGSDRKWAYGKSNIANLFSLLPWAGHARDFTAAVTVPVDNDTVTLGEWMQAQGLSTEVDQLGASRTNAGIWLLMSQMSWLLSCQYQTVLEYPAKIILDFMNGINMNWRMLVTRTKASALRIYPSVDRLRIALGYGTTLNLSSKVDRIGSSKVINGVEYDAVVIATEASSVNHILEAPREVFDEIKYEFSTAAVHCDPRLMPHNRADWRTLNVAHETANSMSMITVWLNAYYPESHFPEDTFMSWNPLQPPSRVQRDYSFTRVAMSAKTPGILRRIERLQGQDGIYYAGSYASYGMGLLEQAAIAGKLAAKKINAEVVVG